MTNRIKTPYDFVEEPAKELPEPVFDKEVFTNWFNDTITQSYNMLDNANRSKESIPKEFKISYMTIPKAYWELIRDKPFEGDMYIAFTQPFWEALHSSGWDIKSESEADMVTFVYKGE